MEEKDILKLKDALPIELHINKKKFKLIGQTRTQTGILYVQNTNFLKLNYLTN